MSYPDPTRSLPLQGASNFRDLGGYAGHQGRPLRWRRLFRSDHLGALTPGDVSALAALGVGRVCDFRGSQERLTAPCAVPGAVVHALPIEPTVVQRLTERMASGATLSPAEMVGLMQQTYRDFVHHNTPRFAALFAHLLDKSEPLVFHCTAGKDRTGFAAAMILLALGVPRDVVMQDYLLTNTHYQMPNPAASELPREALRVLWRVQEEFLNAALHAVDADFGGVQKYLVNQLHVGPREQARLAELYLQP